MTSDDPYRRLALVFRDATERAVLLAPLHPDLDPAWIPRSLLHGADDRLVDRLSPGEEVELRVRAWKLARLGWADGA